MFNMIFDLKIYCLRTKIRNSSDYELIFAESEILQKLSGVNYICGSLNVYMSLDKCLR